MTNERAILALCPVETKSLKFTEGPRGGLSGYQQNASLNPHDNCLCLIAVSRGIVEQPQVA